MNNLDYKNTLKKYEVFKDCNLPVSYWNEDRQVLEFVYYNKDNKINDLLNYRISNNLLDPLSSIAFTSLYYSFESGDFIKDEEGKFVKIVGHNHAHSFEEVVRYLYAFPETFKVTFDDEKYYSKQELDYLRRVQKYLLFIGLRDEDIPKYDNDGNKIVDYSRFNTKYSKCKIIACNDSAIEKINSGVKNYFVIVTEYPELYKDEDCLDTEALIVNTFDDFKFHIKYRYYKKFLYKDMQELCDLENLKDDDVVIVEYFDVIARY